ncbi:hypothetical protein [Paenibacillus sp. P32E]|uniref:hypothetical protein n=1 Tax=Paenibacillus sp. P32E TaxID=1349434 RepID=UPI000939F292|nr:hypothetical protein [Paenibacillus sp. P32E]OKP84583.1 hypothetical protein A3848_25305 [Paenibacillus sp. P32E]
MCTFINFGNPNADNLPFYLTDSKGNKLDTGVADQGEPEGVFAFMTVVHKLPQEMVLQVNVNCPTEVINPKYQVIRV